MFNIGKNILFFILTTKLIKCDSAGIVALANANFFFSFWPNLVFR